MVAKLNLPRVGCIQVCVMPGWEFLPHKGLWAGVYLPLLGPATHGGRGARVLPTGLATCFIFRRSILVSPLKCFSRAGSALRQTTYLEESVGPQQLHSLLHG